MLCVEEDATLNNDGRELEVPRLLSETVRSPDPLALGPATVRLRAVPPWRSAFPMAGRDAAAGFDAWIPPMPKGDPGTDKNDASIVAMSRGDGRWRARDLDPAVVAALLGRRRSVLEVAMLEPGADAKNGNEAIAGATHVVNEN